MCSESTRSTILVATKIAYNKQDFLQIQFRLLSNVYIDEKNLYPIHTIK